MESPGRLAIGRLAKQTGTNVETIRYYEHMGLWVAPARSAGGYRLYGTEHLKRLNFIRRARLLGFSVDEVRTLLRLADERERPCAEVRVVAETHLADVRNKLADLRRMERVLRETVARCVAGTGAHCELIDALYRDATPGGKALQAVGEAPRRQRGLRAKPSRLKRQTDQRGDTSVS